MSEEPSLCVTISLNKEVWEKLPQHMQWAFYEMWEKEIQKAAIKVNRQLSYYSCMTKNDDQLDPEKTWEDLVPD